MGLSGVIGYALFFGSIWLSRCVCSPAPRGIIRYLFCFSVECFVGLVSLLDRPRGAVTVLFPITR